MNFFDKLTFLSIILLIAGSLSAQDCPDFTQNNLLRTTENCQSGIIECLPIDYEFSGEYEYTLDGTPYNGNLSACGGQTIAAYDVLGIANYPINLDSWEVDGNVFNNFIIGSPNAFADTLTMLSGVTWTFDDMNFKIETSSPPDSLGWLSWTEINTGLTAATTPEFSSVNSQTGFEFPIGNHVFVAYNFLEDCADTLLIDVVCEQITDTLVLSILEGESDSIFFDTSNLGPIDYFANECATQSGAYVDFQTIGGANGLYFEGILPGTEQACIVLCDVNGNCDTTYVFVTVEPFVTCTDPVIDFVNVIDMNCDEPGSIQLFMQDQNQDYDFNWDNNLPNSDYVFDLSEGTYNVTITTGDSTQQLCTTTATYTVAFLDSLESYSHWITPSCDNNGIVSFAPMGLTYTWFDGFVGAERFDVAPGIYEVTVSSNNCEEVTTVVMPESVMEITGSVSNVCDSLGSIYLDVSGGFSPYTYFWGDGATSSNRVSVNVGTYTVTVTDTQGCTAENTFEVVDDCPSGCTFPQITNIIKVNPSCTETGSLTVQLLDNSVDYVFDWSHGGPNSAIQTDLDPGTYNVTITNTDPATGAVCTATAESTLWNLDSLSFFLVGSGPATCAAPGFAEYSDPTLIYTWSDGVTSYLRDDLVAGNYTVTVTSPNGNCQAVDFLTIQQGSNIVLNGFAANVCDTLGSIYLTVSGGAWPYTYQWSNGVTTLSQPELNVGTYTITVTDDLGCTLTQTYTIVDDCPSSGCIEPIIVATDTRDPDCNNPGRILLEVGNFDPNMFYTWSHGGPNSNIQTDLSAGDYEVTISNIDPVTGVSCFTTASFTLFQNDSLGVFLVSSTPAGCNGPGTAEYSDPTLIYTWSDGGVGYTRNDLAAGTYTITVTNSIESCTEINSLTITNNSAIDASTLVSNVCDTLGSIYINVDGGTWPYTFDWADIPGNMNQGWREAVDVGNYSVTITDASGCTLALDFTIVDDCPMTGDLIFTFIPGDEDVLCGESAPIINPIAESDCPGDINYTFTETQSPNCGNTNILTREWIATDACGNTAVAQQTIFENDFEVPEIITVGNITVDLLNGDSLPDPLGFATAEDDCGLIADLSYTKEESITTDGYQVAYTWTAIDECGNLSTELHTVDVTGGMIWPGDTDSNKVVNNFDVFNIGFAYGETGPTRMSPTLDFLPQYAAPWSANGLDDVNFRHADTDGNGIVDEQDILAVNLNYDLTHNLQEQGDTRETFEVDFIYETVTADNWVHVAVMLGNTAEPIDDFYGAGFTIEYDQNMVVPNTAHVDFSESWTGTFFSDFLALQKDFYDEGRLDVGLVRINQQGVDGSGKIGSFRFQLPEGVDFTPFMLTARAGEGVRADKSPYELETTEVIVTNVKDILSPAAIDIYPNPVQTELFLDIPNDLEVTDIQLFGANGQMVQEYADLTTRTLDVGSLPAGLYYLRILTTEGTWTDKVSIMK